MRRTLVLAAAVTLFASGSVVAQTNRMGVVSDQGYPGSGGVVYDQTFQNTMAMPGAPGMQGTVGMPGIQYAHTVAGGDGVQLYPYDQQDPWLHGYYQRVPAYGGFASFRPYNYRHVFAQTQVATVWGASHGMPYSQQFWNKYRPPYLDQHLHSQTSPSQHGTPTIHETAEPLSNPLGMPIYPVSGVRHIGYEMQPTPSVPVNTSGAMVPMDHGRPIHIFPR
jgi:hypothetical protein